MLRWLTKYCGIPLPLVLGAAFLGATLSTAPVNAQSPERKFESLTIITATGRHPFKVEVMRKREELTRGLMFRRHLPANQGMLFDFGKTGPVGMWMRNTYIPLDMIFIDAKGVVANVAENTEPLSEETLVAVRPVLSVLEVIAGTAKRLKIRAGDKVEHPLFGK